MPQKSYTCEPCAKLCEEAKQNVKKLQKKLYIMTIVCTAAITLLGEQGAKALVSALETTKTAMSFDKDSQEKEQSLETINKDKNKEVFNNFKKEKTSKQFIKKYELTDELAKLPKKQESSYVNFKLFDIKEINLKPEIQNKTDSKNIKVCKINYEEPIKFQNLYVFNDNANNLNYLNSFGNLNQNTFVPWNNDYSNSVFVPGPSVLVTSACFLIFTNRNRY
jgi:hypothetical protein